MKARHWFMMPSPGSYLLGSSGGGARSLGDRAETVQEAWVNKPQTETGVPGWNQDHWTRRKDHACHGMRMGFGRRTAECFRPRLSANCSYAYLSPCPFPAGKIKWTIEFSLKRKKERKGKSEDSTRRFIKRNRRRLSLWGRCICRAIFPLLFVTNDSYWQMKSVMSYSVLDYSITTISFFSFMRKQKHCSICIFTHIWPQPSRLNNTDKTHFLQHAHPSPSAWRGQLPNSSSTRSRSTRWWICVMELFGVSEHNSIKHLYLI